MAYAPYRGAFGAAQKLLFLPCEQIDERSRVQVMARREFVLAAHVCVTIPGAYQLAIVTPVDTIAHHRTKLERDAAVQFYCEIGDAAARIQSIGTDDGARGAHIDARAATAAVIGRRLIHGQGQIGIYLAEKKPRARTAVDEIGVFAYPAQARLFRERLLEHGRAVGEDAIAEFTDRLRDPVRERLQTAAQQLVVIAGEHGLGRVHVFRQIIHARGDHAHRRGHELGGAAAFAAVTRHVVHLAVMACVPPPLQMRLVRGEFGVGDADLLKAELAAPSFDVTGELRPVAWRKILGLLRVFHSRYDNPHA